MLLQITLLFIFQYETFKYQASSVSFKALTNFKPLALDLETWTNSRSHPILFAMLVIIEINLKLVQ